MQQHLDFFPVGQAKGIGVLDGDRHQRVEVRRQWKQLSDIPADRGRWRVAGECFGVRHWYDHPAMFQHAVPSAVGAPVIGVFAGGAGAHDAAGHVYRSDNHVDQL